MTPVAQQNVLSLDPQNREHLRAVFQLHANLLPDSPIPQLGKEFVTRFYYKKLIESGLIHCDLYRHEGRFVAFSVYTSYPYTFMQEGQRRFRSLLAWILFKAILSRPRRLKVIFKTMQQARRRRLLSDERTGEYLSLGVLPEAASHRDEVTGLRIPNLLFERVIDFFKRTQTEEILLMIRRDNRLSLHFYQSYGAQAKESDFVPQNCVLKSVYVNKHP